VRPMILLNCMWCQISYISTTWCLTSVIPIYLTEATHLTQMTLYYVIFNGKYAGGTWVGVSAVGMGWEVLGTRKIITISRLIENFVQPCGWCYPATEPTSLLPYDSVTHDAFAPLVPPSDGHGKGGESI
jgi:hypothetical protein